jgi:hypothetical protein
MRSDRNQGISISSDRVVARPRVEDIQNEGFSGHKEISSSSAPEGNLSHAFSSKRKDGEQSGNEHDSNGGGERVSYLRKSDEPDADSEQDFADISNNIEEVDDPDLLRFEMMGVRTNDLPRHRRTRSDPAGTVVLCPIYSGEWTSHREIRNTRRIPSPDLEWHDDHEEPLRNRADSAPETRGVDIAGSQKEPLQTSTALERPVPLPSSGTEMALEEHIALSQGSRTPPAWPTETIDGDAQQFLPDRAYLDEVPRMSLASVQSHTVERASPPISTVSDRASFHLWRGTDLHVLRADNRETRVINGEVLSLGPRVRAPTTPGRFPIDSPSEEEVSHIRPHNCKPSDHENGVTCSRISYERYPIDGHDKIPGDSGRTSRIGGSKGTQPGPVLQRGRSFLQRLPKVFPKLRENKQTNQEGCPPRKSSITGSLFRRKSSKAAWCSSAEADSPPKAGPKHTIPAYQFDGACDEDDSLSRMSTVDLNKALPQPPLTENNAPPCPTGTPSLTHSHESKTRPSTASTGVSEISRVSSKKRFHRTAHELVYPEMAGSREPSPLRELDSDKFLVGSKYDPLASPKLPDT